MSRQPSRNNSTRSSPLLTTANVAANDEYCYGGASAAAVAEGERKRKRESIKNKKNNNDDDNNTPFNGSQQSAQKRKTNSSSSFVNNDENEQNGVSSIAISPSRLQSCASTVSAPTKTSSQTSSQASSSASTVKSQRVFKDVNDLINYFIHDPELASTLKMLLKCRTMNNKFARELRDRYLAILSTKRDADAQTYLNEAHASRDKMAIPINSCVRDKGRHEGERYVANFGMLPKDVAGVIAVLCYYLANYATLECTNYDGNGDDNNRVDVDNNASMNMLRKGLPTMIVNEYNRTLDVSTHHLHAVKNDNGEATTVSDINVACLDKGTYPGHYKVDVNMLVKLLGLHNVLPVKNMNQATKVGRLIFQLAGLLGLIENVVAKWLVTNFEEQVNIMVCGSNAGALIGNADSSLIKWRKGPHPESWCAGEGYFSNGNLYSNAKLTKIDEILKEWYIRTLGIIDLPNDDNKQAMEEQLEAHEVRVTYRFGNKNLTEEERQQLGGKTKRQKAFKDSGSNGCILFYHLGSNATYAIGNNQTTSAFESSMWGNQAVGRCHFYRLKLSKEVSSNLCTLDDGIRLQEKLNEALDKLTDQDVAERLAALSEHGVDGYEVPKEDTWEKHKRELKSIADNEGSWVNVETVKVLLLSTGNHGNSTAALYSYVSKHFLNQPIEYLKGLDEWDDISDFNWHLHKSARSKRDEEEEGGAPKAPLNTREKKRQLMRERMKEMLKSN